MTHPARIARNHLEAAAILERFGEHDTAQFLRSWHPVPPPALPYHKDVSPLARKHRWHERAPASPGTYQWRRDETWEPISREIPLSRELYSHRYCKAVPVEAIGGEWLY